MSDANIKRCVTSSKSLLIPPLSRNINDPERLVLCVVYFLFFSVYSEFDPLTLKTQIETHIHMYMYKYTRQKQLRVNFKGILQSLAKIIILFDLRRYSVCYLVETPSKVQSLLVLSRIYQDSLQKLSNHYKKTAYYCFNQYLRPRGIS